MSEKDELISLLRNIEKMMRVDPEGFINSKDYGEKITRFNSLAPLISTFKLTEEESEEIKNLWDSLKSHIEKQNKKAKAIANELPKTTLTRTLREIKEKWNNATPTEKRRMINTVATLESRKSVIESMTPAEKEEYYKLMGEIRSNAIVEELSLEEFESESRRRAGL